jgi:hypothetical protein
MFVVLLVEQRHRMFLDNSRCRLERDTVNCGLALSDQMELPNNVFYIFRRARGRRYRRRSS